MSSPKITIIKSLLARIPATESGAKVAGILTHILGLVEAVEHHRQNPDEMKSEKANALVIDGARRRLAEAVEKAREQISAMTNAERKAADASQIQRASLVADEYAAEIRMVFRGLDDKARGEFMKNAVDGRDAATVAAIVLAPTSVTGLSPDRAAAYRDSFLNRAAPMDRSGADEIDSIASGALRAAMTV